MWKKLTSWILILLSILILFFMIFSDQDTRKTKIQAEDGVLDLTSITLDEQIVALSGEWKFIPGELSATQIFQEDAPTQVVPGAWKVDAQFGTYQLKIKLPEHFKDIGLRIRNIWSAHQLYINGEELASQGKVGTEKVDVDPSNPTYEVYFTPETKTIILTIQVADFYNARQGIIFPIDIGVAEAIQNDVIQDVNLEWTVILLLLIFSIFHFSLFLLRTKDKAFFYSAFYFISLAVLVLTRGERILLRYFPDLPFEFYFRFQDFITFFNGFMLIYFVYYTIDAVLKRRTVFMLSLPLIIYSIAILLFPARELSSMQYVFFGYMNLLAFLLGVRCLFLFITKRTKAPKNELVTLILIFFSILIFSLSGTFDQLFFSGRNIFNRIGMVLFLLSMNIFLALRLVNRTIDAEMFSERLEKATIGKDSFLEVTTKELEQPLYHALNITRTIGENQSSDEKRLLEQQLERLLYLVSDLKDFTRIRFEEFQISVSSINLQMILQHVTTMHALTMEKKGICLFLQVDSTLEVTANEQKLSQIMYRVLETAIHHAVNGQVIISVMHLDTDVRITIEGNGPEVTTLIAADETGQSIGQAIIEQMRGSYVVNTTEHGIRYTITLPFAKYAKQHEMQLASNAHDKSLVSDTRLPQLLIVEDDVTHAEVLQALLSSHYTIQLAHNAETVLVKLEDCKPDFLLMDEVMPHKDGLALTKIIREKYSYFDLPIIMLVADEYPTNISLVLGAGANDYVRKPATKETIMARLSAISLTKEAMNKAVENEMAFLQAQIKPHFLYNALSSIIYFCYTDGEKAGHLLTMLSTYLRYIFESSKESTIATVEKELEIIEAYVEIEQARFGERLTVQIEIDETLNLNMTKVELPSLLIQPLVENAIRHGIFEKEGEGHVTITIQQFSQMIQIKVIDDGIGMTEEQVTMLMEGKIISSSGIGFSNVLRLLRRVREMQSATLTVHSEVNEGTTVTLTLPTKGE
ncbi:histidine kinase [Lysinibacillus sp. KU-BSD001]|uniref:hybrid sensor histidine kinase/response regulator n=1 Tax=Lysinibacillus sp. KU-BSD001 TaxID=3141328 RepID=UPI0036ED82B7